MPRLQARIAFSEIDVQTVLAAHRLIKRRFESSGTGDLLFDETALREKLANDIRHFNSSAHHMGTSRMGTDPHTSVVDSDCQVHGVHNLYLAGASVFPTSGHANPTLTLVALAVRLAEHLKAMPSSQTVLDTRVSRQPNHPSAETLAQTALSR
jgi:choline dehydrogenase-like flavoprotein